MVDLLEFQSLTAGYHDIPVVTEISLVVSKAELSPSWGRTAPVSPRF